MDASDLENLRLHLRPFGISAGTGTAGLHLSTSGGPLATCGNADDAWRLVALLENVRDQAAGNAQVTGQQVIDAIAQVRKWSHQQIDDMLRVLAVYDLLRSGGRDRGGVKARCDFIADFAISKGAALTGDGQPLQRALVDYVRRATGARA